MKDFKILDCTLRDGGYYTNWDFHQPLVDKYFSSFNSLPVDYLEIGYRSNPLDQYLGEYYYCPNYVLEKIRLRSNKQLAIMLNEKDIGDNDASELLKPCMGLVDMVRIAVNPDHMPRALKLAERVRALNFKTGFNVMYMSTWKEKKGFMEGLGELEGLVDYLYLVDSYGGVFPEDVKEIIESVRNFTQVKLGFHGHNNLEMGLINTLTALEQGIDIVDATVSGMGRGAGNLRTELLLTALSQRCNLKVNFNSLSEIVGEFENLRHNHGWGASLPYMVSGANSLPQKDVMEWVTKRYYSFNSIIRALHIRKEGIEDNTKLNIFIPDKAFKHVVVIGGGPGAIEHVEAVKQFIAEQDDICLIHASSKNAKEYQDLILPQFFCLVGSEGHRLEKVFDDLSGFSGKCILPAFPRKMGTYIPEKVKDDCFELETVDFTDILKDSHTALALQTSLNLQAKNIYLVGYDGYFEKTITQLERELSEENEYLFSAMSKMDTQLIAITPTKYKNLTISSVYSLLA